MIDDLLIDVLRCPSDRSLVARAEQPLVERMNRGIAAGRVSNLAGRVITKAIDGGLVREAGDLMYLVVDGIPVMLPDEAVEILQVDEGG